MLQEQQITTTKQPRITQFDSKTNVRKKGKGVSSKIFTYDKDELDQLSKKIADATIKWVTLIAKNSQYSLKNYTKDQDLLRRNIWYPEDHLIACQEVNQKPLFKFTQERMLQGYAPKDYFDRIPLNIPKSEFKYRAWEFLAKPQQPSIAFLKAVQGLILGDCGNACRLATLGALYDAFGKDKFDILFGEKGQPFNIGFGGEELQPMRYFMRFSEASFSKEIGKEGERDVKEGQIVGFQGVDLHCYKHPLSHWTNLNTICVKATKGDQKFVTLGLDPKGLNEREITDLFWSKFNSNRIPYTFIPNNISSINLAKEQYEDIKDEPIAMMVVNSFLSQAKVGGFQQNSIQEFIIEIISDVVKLPLEQVSMDLVKNHPLNKNRF